MGAFHFNNARSEDDTSSGASSSDSSSNASRDRIIIGVVVGGVAAIAITAGILFVLLKKRKWDRIRRYEERVLAAHAADGISGHGYKGYGFAPGDLELGDTRASSSLSWTYGGEPQSLEQNQGQELGQHQSHSQRQGQGQTQRRESHDCSPPPAYQPLPVYDPSRYSGIGISRLPAAVKPSWIMGSRGSMTIAGSGSGSGSSTDRHRHSTTYIGGLNQSSNQRGDPLNRTSPEGSRPVESGTGGSPSDQVRGPRRPKPVLSRLITNL